MTLSKLKTSLDFSINFIQKKSKKEKQKNKKEIL